jgi:hypothetical protein
VSGHTRIVLESNLGGLSMVLCGCGVLLVETMQNAHMEHCPTYLQYLADEAAAEAEQ